MPYFAYKARDAGGKLIEGVLEGASSGGVADLLLGRGVTPVSIEETRARGQGNGNAALTLFKPRVQHVDILLFSRQIHTLLKAGVPIMRALNGLQESATNPAMKEVIRDVRESLEAGRELSVSLARHPKVFSSFYISMVRVGEATGLLDEIFLRLFEHLEFERFMREQVKSALRYPMFVVIAMAVAIVVVNLFVIPAFAKVFQGFGAELPLMTRLLLGFSDFMVTWWPAMLVALIGGIVAFRAWVGTHAGRMQWEALALRFPIAGKIVSKAAMARFARSFALSTRSGAPNMVNRPFPRTPFTAMVSMAMSCGGTKRVSMPPSAPSQRTSAPRARKACATARPGKMWPPVPPAITKIRGAGVLNAPSASRPLPQIQRRACPSTAPPAGVTATTHGCCLAPAPAVARPAAVCPPMPHSTPPGEWLPAARRGRTHTTHATTTPSPRKSSTRWNHHTTLAARSGPWSAARPD